MCWIKKIQLLTDGPERKSVELMMEINIIDKSNLTSFYEIRLPVELCIDEITYLPESWQQNG